MHITIELPRPVAPPLWRASLLGLVISLIGLSALLAPSSPAKAAPTIGAAVSVRESEELRAIQAVLANRTRAAQDVVAISDGRRQAEKTDCRHTSGLCRIAPDATLA